MQAVILAGGLGTRLRPITEQIPKPMIPVLNKPFLEYQLELLKDNGITDIVITIGYLGNRISEYFNDGHKLGVNIKYSSEVEPLGTGSGLREAADLLESNFFLIYGDSYLPINYRELEAYFLKSKKIGVVVAYDNSGKDSTEVPNISLDGNLMVNKYSKGSGLSDLRFVDAGVSVLSKNILHYMPKSKSVSLEEDVFPELIRINELKGFVTEQRFYDIGSQERINKFAEIFQ